MAKRLWTDKNRYRNLAEDVPLKTPLSILIEPTNRCNFRCIFCPTGNRELLEKAGRPMGDMDIEVFKKIVSDMELFPDKVKRISLYKDGEPFLHPDLPEMIRFLKDRDVCNEVSTTSNGTLLTEKLALRLIKAGLDSIRFSIVSVSEKGYKELARAGYDYNTVRQNIGLLRELREVSGQKNPNIYTKIIDFNLSERDKQRFNREFSGISDEISIENPMNWDGSHMEDFTLGRRNSVNSRILSRERKVCPRPWYTMAINFNGRVSVCCVDWSYKTIIGDVNDESLIDIWLGPRMHEFRRMHAEMRKYENPVCGDCEYMRGARESSDLDSVARNDIERLLMKPVL